jgi:hypothetical protein
MIKFAVSEKSKKILRKIFFSGFSETDQANFIWALIFWSFLIKQKGHKRFYQITFMGLS